MFVLNHDCEANRHLNPMLLAFLCFGFNGATQQIQTSNE